MGRYPSGQRGQTVNLLHLCFRGSNPLLPIFIICCARAQKASGALNGEEGIKLAKANRPDLIILDIVLPGLDGGSVADILSNDSATAHIPILFLTGILSKEEELLSKKEGGKKSGKHFMMAKPVSPEDLLEMLRKIIP